MAEAFVGSAFLSATLQVLFDRMASRLFVDFVLGRKFSDALLKKLKIKLLAVNAVLNDAENKHFTDPLVRAWLDELKDAVYDAEDLVDEITTEALRRKLDTESHASADQVQKVKSTLFSLFDEGMKSKIEEILEKLEYVAQQKDVLGLKQVVRGKPLQRLPTTSLVEESGVYGRDHDKEKIIEWLLSNEASRNEIGVIPIVGMAGVGKTTLAQLVYNDGRLKDCFDLKSWVCVSEEFDAVRITKTIVEAVTSLAFDSNDLNLLQVRLKENFIRKKFLLILDDVWNENYIVWDILRSPFRFGAIGSKIIVTTRSENVASIMGSVPMHHLNQLCDEDCWLLFANHALDKNNSSKLQQLEVFSKKIVKKCKGLPLAAKTLGGLLRSNENVTDWEKILNSEFWEFPNDKSSLLPALRLSYHYLPSHLKCCFAYCSVFPKDYEFEKQQVVLLWMAQDFLQDPHRSKDMEEVGNEYFDDLISRSLFQRSSCNKSSFVMHDLVNDLAKVVCGEFCCRLEDNILNGIPEKTRHLSYIRNNYDSSWKLEDFNGSKCLRTFLPLESSIRTLSFYLTEKVQNASLLTHRCLRVLSLALFHNVRELPDSIGDLKHLRYLDLSCTLIQKLPDSTSTLCNLQTLILSGCNYLIELPSSMGKLINLRHLDVCGTKLKEMPMHMCKLINLRTLSIFAVSKHSRSSITELGELKHLQGALKILNLQNVVHARDALAANLKDKTHLDDLLLEWGVDTEDSQHARDVLDKLQPQTKLKRLTIRHYGGTRFPNWLGDHSFSNMVFLCLRNCKYCFSLPLLGRLPSLRELSIIKFDGVVNVGHEFYENDDSSIKPFGSLEILRLKDMLEWEQWLFSDGEGSEFPCLKQLYIKNCPKLKGGLPDHLPHLAELVISGCQQLAASLPMSPFLCKLDLVDCDKLALFSFNDDLSVHPSFNVPKRIPRVELQCLYMSCLKNLAITGMADLKEFPPGLLQSLTAIEVVSMFTCPSLESFPMSGLPITLKSICIWDCGKVNLFLPEPDGEIQMAHYSYKSLETLSVNSRCDPIKSFPLGLFIKLNDLRLSDCINMECLWIPEGVPGDLLTSLGSLCLGKCPKLQGFPKGGLPAPNLTFLRIWGCQSLKTLPEGMHNLLPSLEYLGVGECPELESFPEGGLPSNLMSLYVADCNKLTAHRKEWGLQKLKHMESFEIRGGSEEVESFPEEWLLPSSLTSLEICSLPNLKYLDKRGLQHLSSLQELKISECSKLQCLPEEGLPTSLSLLEIQKCPLLQQWCRREKGEGWSKIAHIPSILTDEELASRTIQLFVPTPCSHIIRPKGWRG